MNKKNLSILAALFTVSAYSAVIWQAKDDTAWNRKLKLSEEGVFQKHAYLPVQSNQSFKVGADKKYTISGEFRLVNTTKVDAFFFGFVPLDANGRQIMIQHHQIIPRTNLAVVTQNAAKGATVIKIANAAGWKGKVTNTFAAFNAKEDKSDLPNYNTFRIKELKINGSEAELILSQALTIDIAAGSKIRLHGIGPAYLYTGCNGRKLTAEWTKFTGTINFDSGAIKWPRGTAFAKVVILSGGRDGIMEFKNVQVSGEEAARPFVREGESNLSRSAVITVSDSAEDAKYRPGSMYDQKDNTAYLTGAVHSDHDLEFTWHNKNVDACGIEIDFTPIKYRYPALFSPQKHLAGKRLPDHQGQSTLPGEIKIEVKQYNQWRSLGVFPVKNNIFSYRFPQKLYDVQRIRISFNSTPENRVAINNIIVAGEINTYGDFKSVIPSMGANGSFYIWHKGLYSRPHTAPVRVYSRTRFTLDEKKIEKAVLMAAAFNYADIYLNGSKILSTRYTGRTGIPKVAYTEIPAGLLKKDNLLAGMNEKTDISDGLYGMIFQLAIRYADGSEKIITSNGKDTRTASGLIPGWEKELSGFDSWQNALNYFPSGAYPGAIWNVDCSTPFFDDEIELVSCKLTPEIPRPGEKYQLELTFDIPEPLKNDYAVTARYGDMPVEMNNTLFLGSGTTGLENGLTQGSTGRQTCIIQGVHLEDVTTSLPCRLTVATAKKQAFIKSRIGKMLPPPAAGQLDIMLGAKEPVLPAGFPDAKIIDGRFYIDGRQTAPMIFGDNQFSAGRIADQLDAGALQIIRFGKQLPIVAGEKERWNMQSHYIEMCRQTVNYALRKNPRAKVMICLDLDPVAKWVLANPDEQIELGDGSRTMGFYLNMEKGPTIQSFASLASQPARKLVRDSLTELFQRLEKEPFANAIVASALCCGLAFENNWGVDRYDFRKGKRRRENSITGDFGVASRKALVRFLDRRYPDDAAWRKAWKLDDRQAKKSDLLSFITWPHERIQNIMLWKDRPADEFIFRDGQKYGRAAEDMNEFTSLQRAEYFLEAAKAIKSATDNRIIVGGYMGYVFPQLINSPVGSSVYSGHAMAKILRESKEFDFFSSPQWYHHADSPAFYSVLNDSLTLYGKTFIAEGDIRTHSAALGNIFNRENMVSDLRKIGGLLLTKKFGAWFLGWTYGFAGHHGIRYFSDPALLRELRALREASELPPVPDAPDGSRIAMIVSEHSSFYMDLISPANTVHANLLYKNLYKFMQTGAGCDIFALEDLPQMVKKGTLKKYRFVAFYNAFHLNKELRDIINTKVKADNRTVLFFYAPGFHDDSFNTNGSSVSTAGIADLTGVDRVSIIRKDYIIGADWGKYGKNDCLVWWDENQKRVFSDKIGPVFFLPGTAGVKKLASLTLDGEIHPDKIAAAEIKGKDHTVIYITIPDIPQKLLNQIVRDSGTIIAAAGDVFVNVGNGFMVVTNDGKAGDLTLKYGVPVNWIELPGNIKRAENSKEITLPFKELESRLFRLEPATK